MRLGWWIGVAALFASGSAQAATCRLGAPGTTAAVEIAGTGRSMRVHVPRGAEAAPSPLVFVFHGSTGNGRTILDQSKLEATSDRHGFLLAAPDGGIPAEGGFVWNIPGVPTVTGKIPGPDDADDIAFVMAAIDQLVAQGCADRARIYATGYSGGGRMTSWLACVATDRFAAIAPVVGLRAGNPLKTWPTVPDPASCTPSRPMPVLAFAGDADTTNPITGGGAGYWRYTMHTALARWADLNGCRVGPVTTRISATVTEERFTRCRSDADVAGRVAHGIGHVWAAADNEAMWRFFARHRR